MNFNRFHERLYYSKTYCLAFRGRITEWDTERKKKKSPNPSDITWDWQRLEGRTPYKLLRTSKTPTDYMSIYLSTGGAVLIVPEINYLRVRVSRHLLLYNGRSLGVWIYWDGGRGDAESAPRYHWFRYLVMLRPSRVSRVWFSIEAGTPDMNVTGNVEGFFIVNFIIALISAGWSAYGGEFIPLRTISNENICKPLNTGTDGFF